MARARDAKRDLASYSGELVNSKLHDEVGRGPRVSTWEEMARVLTLPRKQVGE